MKYLIENKILFKMSDRNWQGFCKAKSQGVDPSPAEFGGVLLEYNVPDITDWDMDDYAKDAKDAAAEPRVDEPKRNRRLSKRS